MDRRVRAVTKDRHGKLVALCNPGESWSPRRVGDVVEDIRHNRRSYYIQEAEARSYLRLLPGGQLRTKADAPPENSLAALQTLR